MNKTKEWLDRYFKGERPAIQELPLKPAGSDFRKEVWKILCEIPYTPWGCIDLVSASTGEYAKRYGMIYVERYDDGTEDFSRRKKKSFEWYKKVIASNGEDLE